MCVFVYAHVCRGISGEHLGSSSEGKNCGGSVRMEGVKDVSLERQGGMIKQSSVKGLMGRKSQNVTTWKVQLY